MIDLSQKKQTTTEVSLYIAKTEILAHFILQEKLRCMQEMGKGVEILHINVFLHTHRLT